jgi:mono/diheme cytochrome c family protein
MLRALLLVAMAVLWNGCHEPSVAPAKAGVDAKIPDVKLSFRRDQRDLRSVSLRELAEHATARVVETDDPYYGVRKHFRALPLNESLAFGFGQGVDQLRRLSFVLRALDGYAVPIEGSRLLEGGAYLAFDDVDVAGFAPIGPQRVSPAPMYLVWTRPTQGNLDTHPRPWQLATIEIAPFEALYPHTLPTGEAADSASMHGFSVFRDHCIKCHAMNREGGRVGPDLNVPQSIIEYRPAEQIRAYVKNPAAFRYGAMPAHPHLSEQDLDGLVAYFAAMAQRKHDPGSKANP